MNDFVWKWDKGLNIVEKIEWKKALCKKAGVVKTFDGYFYEKLDKGVKFYVRDTDMKD
jgi:predicted peroxiredoxin